MIATYVDCTTANWTYDARERMSSDTVSLIAVGYGVNGLGQRITKSLPAIPPANINEYVYDEKGHLLGEYDGAGNTLQETVWLGDVPVAAFAISGTSVTPYYHNPDNLNAPHIITDGSGNQVWTWDHLAFGDNAPNQNPSGLGIFNYNPRFPGQYADAESGLSYNTARDYNPVLGRYIESDPIGLAAGVNTYGYVSGNPVSAIDPTGTDEVVPLIRFLVPAIPVIIQQMNNIIHFPKQTPIPANDNTQPDPQNNNNCPLSHELPQNMCASGNISCVYQCPTELRRLDFISRLTPSCPASIRPSEGVPYTPIKPVN